jgi:NAD(P)-dependent dehydrogenase (short-subunit alcohol dehydrogenase family)
MPVLVVTGASGGLGAVIARAGAAQGWAVAVNYRSDRAGAEGIVAEIEAAAGRAIAVGADVSVESDVRHLFDAATAAFGQVTGLVNNAGGGKAVRVENVDRAAYDTILNDNLAAAVLCSAEAVRRMSTARGGTGGVIVNISSMGAPAGGIPGSVIYAAAKSGIDALTLGLAREVATDGIRVAGIRPGMIETPRQLRKPPEVRADLVSKLPIRRMAKPDEIADAVMYLLSDKASYATGTIMNMGGGAR